MAKETAKEPGKITVIELFAGVGGFRVGLEGKWPKDMSRHSIEWSPKTAQASKFSVIWSNQWEPSTKAQHAADVYRNVFGEISNTDIAQVVKDQFDTIPDHRLLVGGFPCQDYSVARTLRQAEGISGKKGVLWWEIHKILEKKKKRGAPTDFLMLENVDRLLKSPASQRGRDFAIMLSSLSKLGYAVEWRVINAADYGMQQRRKRTYILAYRKGTKMYEYMNSTPAADWIFSEGVFAKAFPIKKEDNAISSFELKTDLAELTQSFGKAEKVSPFKEAGIMKNNKVHTTKITHDYKGAYIKRLGEILLDEEEVPEEFVISEKDLPKWEELKNAKKAERTRKDGSTYFYSEGSMAFPDYLDKPSRTIVTGEGGTTPSRFKHIIERSRAGKTIHRRLTPIELERLDMFPDNHTKKAKDGNGIIREVSDITRAFFMGNALVVGVIHRLGKELAKAIEESER